MEVLPPREVAIESMPATLSLEPPMAVETGLRMAEEPLRIAGPLRDVSLAGTAFRPLPPLGRVGPPALSRAYEQRWEESHPKAEQAASMMECLRPALEPSVLSAETAAWILPSELRSHQVEAVNAFLGHEAFLLADDPGTGRSVAAIVAMMGKFQIGEARRALMVTSASSLRSASRLLRLWAPGLLVTAVRGGADSRRLDWVTPANVYVCDYGTLETDIEQGLLSGKDLEFDLLLLDDLPTTGLRFQSFPAVLKQVEARIRWGLAGAPPESAEDWVVLISLLQPQASKSLAGITQPEAKRRFQENLLRRSKGELREQLPVRRRDEIWVDLDPAHYRRYEEVLAEERHRLAQLGEAATTAHVEAALERLDRVLNFLPGTLDGAKVRALVDRIEQIAASDSKAVVFSHFQEDGIGRLQPALEAYGVLRLGRNDPAERAHKILEAFREQEHWHVLLMEMGARTGDQPLVEASYILHYDHHWNPGVRLRAEMRLHPQIFRAVPINIYEFWVAGTVDEKLFGLLAEKDMLPAEVPEETQPTELADRITLEEWIERILEVPRGGVPERIPLVQEIGTGILPGTSVLRSRLTGLSADTLMAAVEMLMKALGYDQVEPLDGPEEEGGFMLAWREGEQGTERVLVRFLRTDENVGVAKARALVKSMEMRGDCQGAYLITTSDFTAACKSFADETEGRLALVSGPELYRHLHILGQF